MSSALALARIGVDIALWMAKLDALWLPVSLVLAVKGKKITV